MTTNRLYDEIAVGDTASLARVVTEHDLVISAHASGNVNPLHRPGLDGDGDGAPEAVAPSMWLGTQFSALLGNKLPGPGTLYRSQTLDFRGRAEVGDTLMVTVTVRDKCPDSIVVLDCRIVNQSDVVLVEGTAEVIAPTQRIETPEDELPDIVVRSCHQFERLIEACSSLRPLATAVVCPEDEASLGGALLARERGLIKPIFVGNRSRILAVAEAEEVDLGDVEMIDVKGHLEASARAVALVHEGMAGAIMKGHVHSNELLGQVTKSQGGLRTTRRVSHVFVMDTPGLDKVLLVTDAAINIAPSLETKVDIVQNAIDLALALGIFEPKVGILSAVETVNPKIPSTLDAAILSKMADRGQIRGGIVDGPLAMDNAMDIEAAQTKGISSLVAGRAQVLVAPNLESGNMLAKELSFVSGAVGAGLVMGARCPIMLTSRADNEMSRLASCALAQAYQYWIDNEMSILAEAKQAVQP